MKVKLLRPLDGKDIGSTVDYPDADAKRLAESGVVEIVSEKSEKAAPAHQNKMAPAPQNKDIGRPRAKKGR